MLEFLALTLNDRSICVPGSVVKLHKVSPHFLRIVDRRTCLRSFDSVASPTIVCTSPVLADAVHRCDCVCRLADAPCENAPGTPGEAPDHNRGNSAVSGGQRPASRHARARFACSRVYRTATSLHHSTGRKVVSEAAAWGSGSFFPN